MEKTYAILHCHTELSTCTTNVDSVTSYDEYIDQAVKDGLYGVTFTEHGNIFEWYHKKLYCEKNGFKYIHAVEAYITEDEPWFEEKPKDRRRDNYHCCLYAKNYDGFRELNHLVSQSFNRDSVEVVPSAGVHYYYRPRISYSELKSTSDDIIISTACMAGILNSGSDELQVDFLQWLTEHKDRCYLEVQHHPCEAQAAYNRKLADISKRTGIPLLACTDTHSLNEEKAYGRSILQKAKKTYFDNESEWDLVYKTYDELVEAFKKQGSLAEDEYISAIENTIAFTDSCETYEISCDKKYPHIYDNPVQTFKNKINEAYKNHPYVKTRYPFHKIKERLYYEMETYEKVGAVDFMLLQVYLREWERRNGIKCGYGRGSVSGSEIAYILGITEMDSMKYDLNFTRFMNKDRVTNADIDTDYSEEDRAKVKYFLLHDNMDLPNIQCSEIVTFNSIKDRGAIRDIGRALEIPLPKVNEIADTIEHDRERVKKQYPELIKAVDIVNETIVSMGTHPSGVLVSDLNLAEEVGLCSSSKSKYPISMLNMKELDKLFYVKLDILGLDNIGIINKTCEMVGLPRLGPDTVDLNDEAVWKSIREDTTGIFQWESESAQAFLQKMFSDRTIATAKQYIKNFSYLKLLSFANGLIRPGCASFRDDVADGNIVKTGFKELDEALAPTFGHVTMQEDILMLLKTFAGYNDAEADLVRRAIAKKYGTESLMDEIHDRFVSYSHEHYGVPTDKLETIFKPIKQGILDASDYAFSWNHSDAYSMIGYISGYLRYYYPCEFITAALNTFTDKPDKTLAFTAYAKSKGILIQHPVFRQSGAEYTCSNNVIYKGIASIKSLSKEAANGLQRLYNNQYASFVDLLTDIKRYTRVDSKQIEILICLDYFKEFGDIHYLLKVTELYTKFRDRLSIKKDDQIVEQVGRDIVESHTKKITDKQYTLSDWLELTRTAIKNITYEPCTIFDHMGYEYEYLGYSDRAIPNINPAVYYVVEKKKRYNNYMVTLHQMCNGRRVEIKLRKTKQNPFKNGDVIRITRITKERKWVKNDDGTWGRGDATEYILDNWNIVNTKPVMSNEIRCTG